MWLQAKFLLSQVWLWHVPQPPKMTIWGWKLIVLFSLWEILILCLKEWRLWRNERNLQWAKCIFTAYYAILTSFSGNNRAKIVIFETLIFVNAKYVVIWHWKMRGIFTLTPSYCAVENFETCESHLLRTSGVHA